MRQATANDEAVLAGMSYVQKTYDRPGPVTAIVVVSTFRDALFAAGWKLINNDSDLGRAINRRIEIVKKGCSR